MPTLTPRSALTFRRSAVAVALTSVAIVVAVLGAGGTFALWNSAAAASTPATVKSGTATLAVTSPLAMSTATLYPGAVITGPVAFTNTGDTPLALQVTALSAGLPVTTFSQALTVGIGAGTAAACLAGTVTATWTGTASSFVAGGIGVTVASGAITNLCISITLATSAASSAQGLSASVSLTVVGSQP